MRKRPKKKEPKIFIGHNIKYFRAEEDLSMDDVAYGTGLSKTAISQMESGQTKRPSVQVASILADYFNTDLETFVLIELT